MTIQDVINECVVALYSNRMVGSSLVLKGGTALSISENIRKRLSIDIDFSVSGEIKNPVSFFGKVEIVLKEHFLKLKHEVFDFSFSKRPSNPNKDDPRFWGGYEVKFKLIPSEHGIGEIEGKRRNALMPHGLGSTNIMLEISEHEYCGLIKEITFEGAIIRAYDPVLLVLEKLRAICQQHPNTSIANSAKTAPGIFMTFIN